jgi:hypothetical protein
MEGGFILENENDGRGPADLEDTHLAEDSAFQVIVDKGSLPRFKCRF